MTPGEASAAGQRIAIDHPEGGRRIAAHVFDLPDGGIAWADEGWSALGNPTHPFHILKGQVAIVSGMPGWLLVGPEDDSSLDPADGEPDGDRDLARAQIEADQGVTL